MIRPSRQDSSVSVQLELRTSYDMPVYYIIVGWGPRRPSIIQLCASRIQKSGSRV
jgi:hypothetical protein